MKLKTLLAPIAAAALISCPALAQDTPSESYDGGSFSIVPPANWLLISGSLTDRELSKLPENIREHYNQRNTDIIFMNIESLDAETKGFKNNLNIVTINEAIPISDDLVKELTTILQQQYDAMFAQTFKLEKTEIVSLDDIDAKAFYLSGTYTVQDYSIKMEQTLIPSQGESLVLTCSYETGKPDTEETAKKCEAAIKSLKLK